MNCKQLIEQLDSLLDGELSPAEESVLQNHLAECESCKELHRQHRHLLEQAAACAKPHEPPVDLWPGIEARIRGVARQSFFGIRAAAAAAVFGIATVVALSIQFPRDDQAIEIQAINIETQPLTRGEARAQLVSMVSPENLSYSPKTEAVLRKNIKVIQQAMLEIETAIDEDPNNPNLRQLMLTIYQQESQLVGSTNRMKVQSAEGQGI